MAVTITNSGFQNNEIGKGDGGIQPSDTKTAAGMRLNNGAPAKDGDNYNINYNNTGKVNAFLDRVISTNQSNTTTYVEARNTSIFELIDRASYDNDNGTPLGSVTSSGSFHYIAPQASMITDSSNIEEQTIEGKKVDVNKRKAEIEEIYMVGAVNAMSAR